MEIRCNWFHDPIVIGHKEPLDDKRVTHTICAACRSRLLEEMAELNVLLDKAERKQFIERLEGKVPSHYEYM